MKPGYLTTEFWVTIFTQLVTILTLTHVITPDLSKSSTGLVDAAAVIASAIAGGWYAHSRAKVKGAPSPNTATTGDAVEISPSATGFGANAVNRDQVEGSGV